MNLHCYENEDEGANKTLEEIRRVETLLVPLDRLLVENHFSPSEMRSWIICQYFSVGVAWFQCAMKMQLTNSEHWASDEGLCLQNEARVHIAEWSHMMLDFFFGLK
jgi:hypothetical protein